MSKKDALTQGGLNLLVLMEHHLWQCALHNELSEIEIAMVTDALAEETWNTVLDHMHEE